MVADDNRLVQLERDMGDMKSLMSKMVDAVTRMALLEERQVTVQNTTQKILDQIEAIKNHQAAVDLASARNAVSVERIQVLEKAVRDHHVEQERNKARFQTLVWTVRAAWTAGAAVAATVGWLIVNAPKQ